MTAILITFVSIAAWVAFFYSPKEDNRSLRVLIKVVSFIVAVSVTIDALKAWGFWVQP